MQFCKFLYIIIFLTISQFASYAQSVVIEVQDEKNQALPGATIMMNETTSDKSFAGVTDQDGKAVFGELTTGMYMLSIQFLGYETLEKTIRVVKNKENFKFSLKETSVNLGEVTVKARRPLMRQEGEKTIVDVEPLVSTTSNTLELLEATPGLYVDPDGGIFLGTTAPAAVYINGREQKMGNQDLNTILRSLPPGSVERIELIRTPSAKYEASSSGGIVNIVLKKGVKIGRFGSVNTGMNQGKQGNYFAGLSYNNGGEFSSYYVNANYTFNGGFDELNVTRQTSAPFVVNQQSEILRKSNQGNLSYGINYAPNEKITWSYDGRLNGSLTNSNTQGLSLINGLTGEKLSEIDNDIDNQTPFISTQNDFGIKYKIDSLGSEWDTKISYNFTNNQMDQEYLANVIFPQIINTAGDGKSYQNRHFVDFSSDLLYKLPYDIKLETGIKSAFQQYSTDASYFYKQGDSDRIQDTRRTNAFTYSENINGVYLQASKPLFWDLLLQTGIRGEHTYMKGVQTIPSDTSFVVNRVDWFPFLYLSRKIFKISDFELRGFLIYRKTITRPTYQNLNPHLQYVDQFMSEVGNPYLVPQFTHNWEANVSVDDMPLFAIGRKSTEGIISQVLYTVPGNAGQAIRTFDNIGKSQEDYFRLIVGLPPVNKYFFVVGAQYNHLSYSGTYDGEPLDFNRGSWLFFTFHSLRITDNTRLTMNGFLYYKGQMSFLELETFGMLNFGLTQQFMDKKLQVTLNARDVLHTMVTGFQLNQGDIIMSGDRYADNQRFGINIRYNFGLEKNDKKKPNQGFEFEMPES